STSRSSAWSSAPPTAPTSGRAPRPAIRKPRSPCSSAPLTNSCAASSACSSSSSSAPGAARRRCWPRRSTALSSRRRSARSPATTPFSSSPAAAAPRRPWSSGSRSTQRHEEQRHAMTTRIVLAYSGALADSVAIPWLAERYGAELIAVTVDIGQGKDVREEIRDRALATGALRAHVVDVRELYLREVILRGLRAGMLWHRGAAMAAALTVPLIAEKLVEIARIEQARAVAHADADGAAAPIHKVL